MRKREKPTTQPKDVSHFRDLQQETARRLGWNLETIIDNANVWFNAQDREGNVLIWNKGAEEISGYSREEVMALGRTWEHLIYPDEGYRREVLKRESALLEDSTNATVMETRIRCKDGQTKTISWRSRNLRDEKGNLVGYFALVLDVTEQKQAEEALRRRAIQLQTIGEVGRRASSILNLDELLSYVVSGIQQNFGYYHVDIFLVDQGYAVFRTSSNPAVGRLWKEQNLRFKAGQEGMIGWVAQNGQPILANDISQEPRYLPNELLPKTQAELTVPIRMDERTIGTLDVQSNVLNAFNKDDIFVLETLASQLAIAIENAGLYAEAKKRAERMATLNRIGLLTTSTLDLNEVLNLIHEQTSQLMKPDTFYIALYDEQKAQISFEIFVEKGESFGKFSRKLGEMGLTGWIIRSKQPLLIGNLAEERPPVEPHVMGELPSKLSYLGVPIMCRGKVTGVISVQSFRPYTFDEEDQRFLTAIANQAGIAIENARLYKEAQHEIAARKDVEEALRESEERFRMLFDGLAIGVYRTTPQGRILMANPALVHMLGYSSFDELAQRNLMLSGFEPAYPRSSFIARMEQEGQAVGLEVAWTKQDGTSLFIRESARTVRDEAGNTLYYEGTAEDITERRQAVEALQRAHDELETQVQKRTLELLQTNETLRSEIAEHGRAEEEIRQLSQYLESIIDNADVWLSVLDENANVTLWNKAAERISGYSREEAVGHNKIWEWLYPDEPYRRKVREEVTGFLRRGGGTKSRERTIRTKNGQARTISFSSRNLIDRESHFVGAISLGRDITEQKTAETELRIKDSAVTSSINAIALANLDGTLTYVNPAFLQLWKYDYREVIGRSVLEFWQSRRTAAEIVETLHQGKAWVGEVVAKKKDGSQFVVQLSANMVTNNTGQPVCMMGSFVDVTERKEAEEKLKRLNETQKRAITVVSHELNTPLTSIKGYADLLRAGHFGPISLKQREILDGIMRNSERLTGLVDAFLNLEKIEARTRQLECSRFPLEELLVDINEMYQLTARENGLQLKADLESELMVNADRVELAQVFSNLISNALKFSNSGTVNMKAQRNANQVVVRITDQGPGIPARDIPLIFDEFYQVQHAPLGTRPQGIGLGLPIAKRLVEAHHGTIRVESQIGKGSTFTVTFPWRKSTQRNVRVTEQAAPTGCQNED